MILREATWRDAWRIWRWRNHPSTRKWMRSTEPIGLLEHLRWFRRVHVRSDGTSPLVILFIAEEWRRGDSKDSTAKPEPVGTGRLDFAYKISQGKYKKPLNVTSPPFRVAYLDVVVGLKFRGRGLGPQIIAKLVSRARSAGALRVYAEIRIDNAASLRAFKSVGFKDKGSSRFSTRFKILRYEGDR